MCPLETSDEKDQVPLPLQADPAAGALIGTFLIALCLGGPVALALALIVWAVYEAVRQALIARGRQQRDGRIDANNRRDGESE
jgi:hypothetical protein